MEISKRFFSYKAEFLEGTAKEIEAELNIINESRDKSLAFTSNLVYTPDGKYALILQIKIPKKSTWA